MEAAQRKTETHSPHNFCMKRFALGIGCLFVLGVVLSACPSSKGGGDTDNNHGAVTVSFDKNNRDAGSTEASPDNMTIRPPATTLGTLPTEPTRPGHKFAGWNMQSDGNGEAFTEETPIQKKIHFIVYAKWEPVLQFGFPRATLTFSPMEREFTFTVTISGLKNVADASSVKLDLSSTNTGSKPLWFLWQEESSPFWEGIKTFVVHVKYRGSDFTETPASLHLTLRDIPKGYEYSGVTRTLRIATASGQKNNPIPVHQDNLKTFNTYANTDGLALHYQLVENVTLPAEQPNNWTAIGTNTAPFTGSFDGGGHSISGLSMKSTANNQGLFGYIRGKNAVVENLGLEGGSVSGSRYVGGVAGYNHEGTVQNCYVTGNVSGSSDSVGGVVGENSGAIQNCYVTGNVTGTSNRESIVGGVVGLNRGEVHNSHASGNVSGTGNDSYGSYVGGVVGRNSGEVHNSHASGNVSVSGSSHSSYVGGVVGQNSGKLHNSYATGSVSGTGDYVGGVVGSNSGKVHNSYATGNVSGSSNSVGGVVGVNSSTGEVHNSYYATGSVSGTGDYVGGVVGYNNGGTVQDCYATGDVEGRRYVGGVAGQNAGGTVQDCYATGDVESRDYGYAGGVVGYNDGGTVQDCYASGNVSGTGDYVGGVVGRNSGEVHNSHATGSVSGTGDDVGGVVGYNGGTVQNSHATGDVEGRGYVGGVVGNNWDGEMHNCYATGSVSGTGNYVGGVVGNNWDGEVYNCYATGSVSGTGDYVGGVVGFNRGDTMQVQDKSGTVQGCYATGDVEGRDNVGGVVGWLSGKLHNSYATGSVSGSGNNVGGVVGFNVNSRMQNCYATGDVTGNRNVGGVVGRNDYGTVQNCVALNSKVTQTSTVSTFGRVVGQNNTGTLTKNHARDDMQLTRNGTPKSPLDNRPGGVDGADVSAEDYSNSPFWKNLSIGAIGSSGRIFWDFQNVWDWQEGLLPILREVGGEQKPKV